MKKSQAEANGEALAVVEKNQLAIADKAQKGDKRGTEGIDNDDVRLPFLAIAQKTSKALEEDSASFVEGLKFGEMYNSETHEVYGKGPLYFIPLVMRKRAHLLKDNGQLGEPVDWNDKRATWEEAHAQERDKPEAMRIYDWVVLILPTMEMAVVSFRSTSFGAGKSLNGFVKMRTPSFAGRYSLNVDLKENSAGKYGKFVVAPAGKPTDDQFEFAELAYPSVQGKAITTSEDVIEGEVKVEHIPF